MDVQSLDNICSDDFTLLAFLQYYNLILGSKICNCNSVCNIYRTKTSFVFRCPKKNCGKRFSVSPNGYFFSQSRLPITQGLRLIYYFCNGATVTQVCKVLNISRVTASDWFNLFRKVCASTLLNQPRSIGGDGKTVEIDHTYFRKYKNEKGKMVPDQYVFGGICRETEEVFLCTVPETTEDAILECIKNNVQPGTTIISDSQPAYKNVENIEGFYYKHLMVNNSENTVDPALNANIQSIENIWFILNERNKKHCGTNRKMFDSYLSEFVWRRRYANQDLFVNILKDIATCHSPKVSPSPSESEQSSSSGKETGTKRKRRNSDESIKLKENESSQLRDPLRIPDEEYKGNDSEDTTPDFFQSHRISSGNILARTVKEDPLCPSSDEQMSSQGFVSEFDLFGESISKRLNSMPRNAAVQLRLKIEELVTNFRSQMSFSTSSNSLAAPFPHNERFINIKTEIKEEVFE